MAESISPQKPDLHHTEELIGLLSFSKVIPNLPKWPIILYFLTAIFCLLSSTAFHWFSTKSLKVNNILHRLDMASIAILVWGSSISLLYYIFFCDYFWLRLYFMMSTLSCLFVFYISMQAWVHEQKWLVFKGNMYVILGVFQGIPIFHGVIKR